MGRYIEWGNVTDRYPLASRVGSDGAIGSSTLLAAEYEIDAKLASEFTVPFSSNNETVKDLCIDNTWARLAARYTVLKKEDYDKLTDSIDKRINALRVGDTVMMTTDGAIAQVSEGQPVWSQDMDYHPVYGMGSIEDMVIDQDQLDDEEDARD